MGKTIRWATVTMHRRDAEASFQRFELEDPALASDIHHALSSQAGVWVNVEAAESDVEKIKKFREQVLWKGE